MYKISFQQLRQQDLSKKYIGYKNKPILTSSYTLNINQNDDYPNLSSEGSYFSIRDYSGSQSSELESDDYSGSESK